MPKIRIEGFDTVKPAGVFEELTPGKYLVRVLEHNFEEKSGKPQITTKVSIIDGPGQGENKTSPEGRKFVDFNHLAKKDGSINEFALSKNKALTEAVGVKSKGGEYEATRVCGQVVTMVVSMQKPTEQYPEPRAQVSTWLPATHDEDGAPSSESKGKGKGKKKSEDWD